MHYCEMKTLLEEFVVPNDIGDMRNASKIFCRQNIFEISSRLLMTMSAKTIEFVLNLLIAIKKYGRLLGCGYCEGDCSVVFDYFKVNKREHLEIWSRVDVGTGGAIIRTYLDHGCDMAFAHYIQSPFKRTTENIGRFAEYDEAFRATDFIFCKISEQKEEESIEAKPLKINEEIKLFMENTHKPVKEEFEEECLERMHEEGFDHDHEKTNSPIF
ncbi:hypothetical protein Tcan_12870 [Toxocara canis]|uniref:Uncharacterized protein n=1 Tax=Toxocara canis TaxID=6265 RepID=A0A0B2V308_TOXCA|nr:hypothetical protein Tcan_12870 [Toxocara canis]